MASQSKDCAFVILAFWAICVEFEESTISVHIDTKMNLHNAIHVKSFGLSGACSICMGRGNH